MNIDATTLDTETLNAQIKQASGCITIEQCLGQRYIGCGCQSQTITIYGTPGNALGSYLNGANIHVHGNAQDAVGDTMNDGLIEVYGNVQDACGYSMRGGTILIKGNAGYRCGVHMKRYEDKQPIIVIGNQAGSFLGEYLAGGTIVVLGLESETFPVGNFMGTGMYEGELYVRCKDVNPALFPHLHVELVDEEMMATLQPILTQYSTTFQVPMATLLALPFYRFTAQTQNPYKLHYIEN